jgi:hypothetical protein
MSQFYFHTRAGDVLVEDHSGHSFHERTTHVPMPFSECRHS